MKKLLLPVMASLLLALFATSCNNGSDNGNEQPIDTVATAPLAKEKVANFPKMDCSTGNCNLSANCHPDSLCSDPDCYASILACHRLTPLQFRILTKGYHDPVYNPKVFAVNDIITTLQGTGGQCNGWNIKIADYSTDLSNDNIIIDLEDKTGDTVEARYTVALFKAILDKDPTEIHFYKAKHADGCEDIVFKAYREGTEVYCGDLSGLEP